MRNLHSRVSGFSLVEMMVAMAIGLIGVIIIFQVFETSEGVRRTTASGGDSQQNGTISLYLIERDLRNAGMGFNDTSIAGCNLLAYDRNRSTPAFPTAPATLPLVPALITPGADAITPDTLSVAYGAGNHVAGSVDLIQNMTIGSTQPLRVRNRYGFRVGDLVVVGDPTPVLAPAVPERCSLMEVTSLPAAPDNELLQHVDTGSRFNPNGGLGVQYGKAGTPFAARVFNIGNLTDPNNSGLPVYNTYWIANKSLMVSNQFVLSPPAGGVPAVNSIADNIVHMRAQYGVDDGGIDAPGVPVSDGRIDRYINTPPNTWATVIAVRVAVVARSALPEKPAAGAGAPCDTTTDAMRPTWSGGTFDLSADPEWRCYRYRVFETTVPLRNWIWRTS